MAHLDKFLVLVESVATITGRGVIIEPEVPLARMPGRFAPPIRVEVRPRDGAKAMRFDATGDIARRARPAGVEPGWTLLLLDAERKDVPVGAEVWLVGDDD